MNYEKLCQIHYQTLDDVPKHRFIDATIREKKIKKPQKYNWKEFYYRLTDQSLKFIVLLLNGKYIGIICIDLQISIKTLLINCHNILSERNLIKNIGLQDVTLILSLNQQEPYYIISDLYHSRLISNLSSLVNIYSNIAIVWDMFNFIDYRI